MERVWVYQSNRFLTETEVEKLKVKLTGFIKEWTAHGSALAGSFDILHDLFIVLRVNEQQAAVTGCSIDKSTYFLKDLEKEFGLNLFDRWSISYRDQDDVIQLASKERFTELIEKGLVGEETVVFNNLVNNHDDFLNKWEVPLKDSWHARVFL